MSSHNGLLSSSGSYSLTYNLPYWFYKFVKAYPMGEISSTAQLRLSAIEFFYQVRNVSVVCTSFKLSRKSFYKWKLRYEASGKRVSSLESLSRAPKSKRNSNLDCTTELDIKHIRQKYIRLGKVKIQKLFKDEYGYYVSQNHISYVIKKHNLYFDPVTASRIRSKKMKGMGHKKIRINEVNPNDYLTSEKPFFFTTDTIVLYLPYGIKRYIITAVEHEKKIAYARVYGSKSSLSAFDFLMRLSVLVDGTIAAILSDNGSEFAHYFEEACHKLKIIHICSRTHTPKDNSVCERFNRTIQEEFMEVDEYFEPLLTESPLVEANKRLTEWLVFYNTKRPHQTLDYRSPFEYYHYKLIQKQKLSPMYPTLTRY